MTRLRKMMLEELQRRNYSENTIRHYIRTVEEFARRFHCSPDRLGPRHIREYQAELFKKGKSPGTVTQRLAALRFFYVKTLKKAWSSADTPYPKRAVHLPTILSQEEVTQLIDAASTPFHRTLLMVLYATGVRRAELTHLKVTDIDSQRMVIHVRGGKGRKDRDVMLSPKLLDELRQHWQRLPEKTERLALSRPEKSLRGSADRHENGLACLSRSREAGRHPQKPTSPHAAPLLRHSSARSRCRSAHYSDPVGSSRSGRDHHLLASLRAAPPRHRQSIGLAAA